MAAHGAFAILPKTVSKAHLVIDMLARLVRFKVAKTNRTTIARFDNLSPQGFLKFQELFFRHMRNWVLHMHIPHAIASPIPSESKILLANPS